MFCTRIILADVFKLGDEDQMPLKSANDDTPIEFFRRVCERVTADDPEAVRDGTLRLDALQQWLQNEIGDSLGFESGAHLFSQLTMEMEIVEHRSFSLHESGGMVEPVDEADEELQAQNYAENLVFGWPSKSTDPVTLRDAGRFVKAHPLDFPMGVGDLHDPDRSRKVSVPEWVQHLLRYRDGRFVAGGRGQRVLWSMVNELLLHEARQRGYAVYRNVKRRIGFTIQGGDSLTKGALRDMLKDERSCRLVTNQLMCLGRDVRTTPMYWNHEGKKLDAGVKHVSWCPPWVDKPVDDGDSDLEVIPRDNYNCSRDSANPRRLGTKYLNNNSSLVDKLGLGRAPSMWFTLNTKYNDANDIHRLNVYSKDAASALDTGVDGYRTIRQQFARDCPDLVGQQIVLRTELNMQIVMPSIIRHSDKWPFLSMTRFEVGPSGNLHAHGLAVGTKSPKMPRRVKAKKLVEGDETSDFESTGGLSDQSVVDVADCGDSAMSVGGVDDGVDDGGDGGCGGGGGGDGAGDGGSGGGDGGCGGGDGGGGGGGCGGSVLPADVDGVPVLLRPGSISCGSSSVVSSIEDRVRSFILDHDISQDIHFSTLLRFFVQHPPLEDFESAAKFLIDDLVSQGVLQCLSGGIYRKTAEVPDHGHLPKRRKKFHWLQRRGEHGVAVEKVRGFHAEEISTCREGVGCKEDLEEKFSRFFQDLVSTWDPSRSKDGAPRFRWNKKMNAYDVDINAADISDLPREGNPLHRWPERVRLSDVLTETFMGSDGTTEKEEVCVQ